MFVVEKGNTVNYLLKPEYVAMSVFFSTRCGVLINVYFCPQIEGVPRTTPHSTAVNTQHCAITRNVTRYCCARCWSLNLDLGIGNKAIAKQQSHMEEYGIIHESSITHGRTQKNTAYYTRRKIRSS